MLPEEVRYFQTGGPNTRYEGGLWPIGLVSELTYAEGRTASLVQSVKGRRKRKAFVLLSILCVNKDIKKNLANVKLHESKLREMYVSVLH